MMEPDNGKTLYELHAEHVKESNPQYANQVLPWDTLSEGAQACWNRTAEEFKIIVLYNSH